MGDNNKTTDSTNTSREQEQDKDCLRVLNTKDYYDVLKIEKSVSQEEIRRAYKKVSVFLRKIDGSKISS